MTAEQGAAVTATTTSAEAKRSAKQKDLAQEIAALKDLDYAELHTMWSRLFRYRAPKKFARDNLELGIAWKLQAQVSGGLNSATRRRLDELAHTLTTKSDLTQKRTTVLKPGVRLLREWAGESHEVLVTEKGFVWRGKTWKSLSVIAREITGARWSGPRFFGLRIAVKRDGDIDA
ncbi:DUF2924 domain-containing protein [Hyphomicrobium sp. MC1]|uniref:DUF2924 domain-containing protein n=1 Tax=Hyphomicrobium sp. (strain MC1) TaxID=717785 RepID=UPI0002EA4B8F|nr:DUF2924 domain-containing protein [Hyphomicrobium sp. MC1]